jgi:hypothetical protein
LKVCIGGTVPMFNFGGWACTDSVRVWCGVCRVGAA